MPLTPHTQLGPYEILGLIGSGGMGEVYKALDSRLGREVAIKVVLPAFASDTERLRRFEQEAKAVAQLNHPNIMQVFDVGMHEGMPYLVMELLDGETLRERMSGKPMAIKKAVDIAVQVAHGLSAAHEKAIVHRDLKPENIFITREERVKILDFGLAKLKPQGFADSDQTQDGATIPIGTRVGVVVGTVGYMSPEQVNGLPLDARSDLFSFGVILWEMLSGKRPFYGDSVVETMHAILKEEPPDLSLDLRIHPTVDRIVHRCLEKDARARFQSAQDLAFNLESVSGTSHSGPLGVPSGSGRFFARPRNRHLWLVASIAALGLGLSGWLALRVRPARPILEFDRLTYSYGLIWSARFSPDGQSYIYSMKQDGRFGELLMGRTDAVGSRPLGFPPGTVIQSISTNSEMALLLPDASGESRILARAPLGGGGAPREVAENIVSADWTADGKDLVVVREQSDGQQSLEIPLGKVAYQAQKIENPRVSPRGDLVAFVEARGGGNVELCVIDRKGKKRVLVKNEISSFQWSVEGKEIYFTLRHEDDRQDLCTVDLSGQIRSIYPVLGRIHIHDISRNGRLLVDHTIKRNGMRCLAPGEKIERELSWLQTSNVADISADGRQLLFGEMREGAHPGGAYLRRTDGSDAVRLGDGDPLQLSLDGKWAAVRTFDTPPAIVILPTGAGQARQLPTHGITPTACWFFPEAQRILVGGHEPGKGYRYFLQEIASGAIRPLTPEGIEDVYYAVSPDGSQIAIGPIEGKLRLYPAQGGEPRIQEGLQASDQIIQWSSDGKRLFLADVRGIPAHVFTYDLATQQRKLWKDIAPPDGFGVNRIKNVVVTPDGSAYAYSFVRTLTSDLYVMRVEK